MTTLEKIRAEITEVNWHKFKQVRINEIDGIEDAESWYQQGYYNAINHAKQIIDKYAEQEPKTGHWEFFCQNWSKCSECGYTHKFAEDWNYCPNCGCRMVKPWESEE